MAWGPRLTAGEFSFCAAPASLFISSSPCTVDGARGLKRVVFGGRPAPFTVTAEAAAGHRVTHQVVRECPETELFLRRRATRSLL